MNIIKKIFGIILYIIVFSSCTSVDLPHEIDEYYNTVESDQYETDSYPNSIKNVINTYKDISINRNFHDSEDVDYVKIKIKYKKDEYESEDDYYKDYYDDYKETKNFIELVYTSNSNTLLPPPNVLFKDLKYHVEIEDIFTNEIKSGCVSIHYNIYLYNIEDLPDNDYIILEFKSESKSIPCEYQLDLKIDYRSSDYQENYITKSYYKDKYEPDNSLDNAKEININEIQTHTFHTNNNESGYDHDIFKIDGIDKDKTYMLLYENSATNKNITVNFIDKENQEYYQKSLSLVNPYEYYDIFKFNKNDFYIMLSGIKGYYTFTVKEMDIDYNKNDKYETDNYSDKIKNKAINELNQIHYLNEDDYDYIKFKINNKHCKKILNVNILDCLSIKKAFSKNEYENNYFEIEIINSAYDRVFHDELLLNDYNDDLTSSTSYINLENDKEYYIKINLSNSSNYLYLIKYLITITDNEDE